MSIEVTLAMTRPWLGLLLFESIQANELQLRYGCALLVSMVLDLVFFFSFLFLFDKLGWTPSNLFVSFDSRRSTLEFSKPTT
jgi:hypothetical protein